MEEQLYIRLGKALGVNSEVIKTHTATIKELVDRLAFMPDKTELKAQAQSCVDVADVKDTVDEIKTKLDKIDAWQKYKLPAVVAVITIAIYAIGFFFTLNQISGHTHKATQQHTHTAKP